MNRRYLADESEAVRELLQLARLDAPTGAQVRQLAVELVESVRRNRTRKGGLDAFLRQYDLASREGVILMCLAEALLRIPDADTADRLIADKIAAGNWSEHVGSSDSLFVNASTWGLLLTGKLVRPDPEDLGNPGAVIAGNVRLDEACFVGAGSTLIERVQVGAGTIVGAGAAVVRDLPAGVTAVGVPARVIRQHA